MGNGQSVGKKWVPNDFRPGLFSRGHVLAGKSTTMAESCTGGKTGIFLWVFQAYLYSLLLI